MTKPISAFDRIEHLAPTGLIAYDRNARKHPKQQIRRIADSIRSFGFNAPVLITTGRRLREHGWPGSADTVAVMLDGQCAFQTLAPAGLHIWWGAYLGMANQLCISGNLAEVGPVIVRERERARAQHGWIMDTYLLKRTSPARTSHAN